MPDFSEAAHVRPRVFRARTEREVPLRKNAADVLDRASLSAGAVQPDGYRLFTVGLCHTRSIALCWMECMAVAQVSVMGRRHSIPHGTPSSKKSGCSGSADGQDHPDR